MAFSVELPRTQNAALWESIGPEKSPEAAVLQELFDKGCSKEFDQARGRYEGAGLDFRLTKGRAFRIIDSENTTTVRIQFQVKGGCFTWYILAPMDETKQSFRDEVYGCAGLGHLKVSRHCEKYWRGTNSLHVKKMHTHEDESGFNHNHYRMKDCDVDTVAVYEHLNGFVESQRELKLFDPTGREKFLDAKEADMIYKRFEEFWVKATYVGPGRTISLGDRVITVLSRKVSEIEEYKSRPDQLLTEEDLKEWEENKAKEEPCLVILNWESMNPSERLKAIAEGMRGLGSELAQTRQIEGSSYKAYSAVVARDDRVTEILSDDIEVSGESDAV